MGRGRIVMVRVPSATGGNKRDQRPVDGLNLKFIGCGETAVNSKRRNGERPKNLALREVAISASGVARFVHGGLVR